MSTIPIHPLFEFGIGTDPGHKRRSEPNQDAVAIIIPEPPCELPPLLVVADGMGGYEGGAIASHLLIDTITTLYQQKTRADDLADFLQACIRAGHKALCEWALNKPKLKSMGTTVVLAAIHNDQIVVANVGDSRAYRLSDKGLVQVNQDHSVVADAVRSGKLTWLQARRHPKRNRLTQSISPRRSEINPYIARVPFPEGDTVILCTDGLWGVATEPVIEQILQDLPPQPAVDRLIEYVNARKAPDNVSAVIARYRTTTQKTYEEDKTDPGL